MQTLGVEEMPQRCSGPAARWPSATHPMPARRFREQLALLATEYGLLEEESHQLRARLSEEPTVSERSSRVAPVLNSTSMPSALSHVDVELEDPRRLLTEDGIHFALPKGHKEEGTEVEMLDSPTSTSVTFAVDAVPPPQGKPATARLTSPVEHPPTMEMAWETMDPRLTIGTDIRDSHLYSLTHAPRFSGNRVSGNRASGNRGNVLKRATTAFFAERPTGAERNRRPIFANAEDMKDRVRAQLTKETYNVTDYYKDEGWAQFIARSSAFETITVFVITLNAVWIWIDTDFNSQEFLTDAHPIFQVAEHFFCFFFFVEIITRFCSFQNKWNGFKDAWFVFDSFLVIVMVLEAWVMTIVILTLSSQGQTSTSLGDTSILRITRLLRLMRMARVARLLRAMPELVILIKGVVAAARSVFFTLLLLLMIMYVYAVALTQMLRDTDPGAEFFDSVPKSMHTLWVRATLLDEIWEVMDQVGKESLGYVVVLDCFILMAALTVMNMLVGVLCEVVSAVAASEREEISLNYVKSKIQTIFSELGLDEDYNHMISKDEFVKLLDNREACQVIQELGVDVVGLVDFAEVFFSADVDDEEFTKELSFSDFMEAVVALRGSNVATVKDIIDLRKIIMESIQKHERSVQEVINKFGREDSTQSVSLKSFPVHGYKKTGLDNNRFQGQFWPGTANGVLKRPSKPNTSDASVTPIVGLSMSEGGKDEKLRRAAGSTVPNGAADVSEESNGAAGQAEKKFVRPVAWD